MNKKEIAQFPKAYTVKSKHMEIKLFKKALDAMGALTEDTFLE